MEQAALRKRMLARRNSLTLRERGRRSRAAARHLLQLDTIRDAAFVCTYLAIGSEVDTSLLLRRCFRNGTRVAVPIIMHGNTGRRAASRHIPMLAELMKQDRLVQGAYGIRQPSAVRPVLAEEVDAFVVPGTAFDVFGNRIGYGTGYYDSLLARVKKGKIGLCYDFQLVPSIRSGRKDVPMDAVVTDMAVIVP